MADTSKIRSLWLRHRKAQVLRGDVRQRQYSIGKDGCVLTTANVGTCTAFMGVLDSGVVFLCHLDSPLCALAMPSLVRDLKKQVGEDLSGFSIYRVTSHSLLRRFLIGLLAVIATAPMAFWLKIAGLVFFTWWYGSAYYIRHMCNTVGRRDFGKTPETLKAKWIDSRLTLKPWVERLPTLIAKLVDGLPASNVSVQISSTEPPKVDAQKGKIEKSRWAEPLWWFLCMTKADDSL